MKLFLLLPKTSYFIIWFLFFISKTIFSQENLKKEDFSIKTGFGQEIADKVSLELEEKEFQNYDYYLEVYQFQVYDPLEFSNRYIFHFNDFLIRYIVVPIAKGYAFIFPHFFRLGVRNIISNIYTPERLVNSLLQLKFAGFARELLRFIINTTIGIGGFFDAAKYFWDIEKSDEDFGQTLGFWGIKEGPYLNLPFIGPSSLRGLFGLIGDIALKPETYIVPIFIEDNLVSSSISVSIFSYRVINEFSIDPEEYERLKEDAIDPYIFFRDIYFQSIRKKVEE